MQRLRPIDSDVAARCGRPAGRRRAGAFRGDARRDIWLAAIASLIVAVTGVALMVITASKEAATPTSVTFGRPWSSSDGVGGGVTSRSRAAGTSFRTA